MHIENQKDKCALKPQVWKLIFKLKVLTLNLMAKMSLYDANMSLNKENHYNNELLIGK